MMSKLLRFSKRQLHTIVSRDIIKPSSPTPSHLKTYNLSLLDRITANAYMPVVAFYPRSSVYQSSLDKTLELKNSLSHTLTQYYPFAGKTKKISPTYVDCNDEGVEFIEACNDSSLSDFLQHSEHEDLNKLFPNDLIWFHPNRKCDDDGLSSTCPLAVQVNHFACGGVAVAISLFHKIGDGSSMLNFLSHWAKVNAGSRVRYQTNASPVNPHFITYQKRNINFQKDFPDVLGRDFVTRSFLFPNQRLNDLKAKVIDMITESREPMIMNPTRVEVITWLIQKCAVAAATKTNSATFKDTGMIYTLNLRNSLMQKLPETSFGNLVTVIEFPTSNQSEEITPRMTIGQLREKKAAFQSITNLETALGIFSDTVTDATILEMSKTVGHYYFYSSLCGFPTYSIDFGWGKPVKVTLAGHGKNVIILMDSPNSSGIEALVSLDRQDMMIFQKDPNLLSFC
ncbi:deacetylvindoline O-acetyltransferase [Artemisia annua]|uniref:Deacetylvindoline O-acetyltransferase n=1 Tax=Artemisia annua TaxID=35608 RepID=A0A2U1MAF1_ARTAN|nr:deacetylvindoline O-acetyltransferase [Artemisia annua]